MNKRKGIVIISLLVVVLAGGAWSLSFSHSVRYTPEKEEVPGALEPEVVEINPELLPDLVPTPAQDIRLEKSSGSTLLLFSTTYFNQGEGPLELIADEATSGVRRDIERNVLQRIHNREGGYRDKIAGTFLWHQTHLHYHFSDFVIYDLEVVEVEGEAPDLSGVRQKSTFCIRDISRVSLELSHAAPEAVYLICGKEKQGISIGWGDTYFSNYPDQNLNISDLPSGRYSLSFIVNPDERFEEVTKENNTSSVILDINMEELTVEVAEEFPHDAPELEHVHPVQENCDYCVL